ncbi:phage recombination protein Bet [Methylobacterium oryzae]|uniref:phage recombination protein Bet n=1 Tax=Methylobacterium oryzae TaxID=334852 RepID=UPI002F2FD217
MNVPARTTAASSPRDYDKSQTSLIRRTYAKDTTDDEFNMFIEICKRQQLDPFRKQIHALVFNKKNADKRQVAFITGIDGYRAIAKRAGNYRPDENEPQITYDESLIGPLNPKGIVKAVVTVWQYAVDGWYPVRGVAMWDEFVPVGDEWENGKRTGKRKIMKDNWVNMPIVMIVKCAEAQALRRGWPEDMGGIYIQEEMDRAMADVTASELVEQHNEEERQKKIGAGVSFPLIFSITQGIEMIPVGQIADKILEHARALETSTDVEMWREMNRTGLQQYWAKNPSEALEVKRQLEEIIETKKQKEKEPVHA